MEDSKQIFQTDSKKRWRSVQWGSRIFIFVAVLLILALGLMMKLDKSPKIPFKEDYKAVMTASKPYLQENKISKEYKGFRSFISEKTMHTNLAKIQQARAERLKNQNKSWSQFPGGIRSAFYVAWDPQSLMSLKRNIRHINLVFPEWFFLDPETGDLKTNIDPEGYKILKRAGVAAMPILSNNSEREFRSEGLGKVLKDPGKRTVLIRKLAQQCQKFHFKGINIDFEDMNLDSDEYLIAFMKELSETFKQNKLLVTMDIMTDNDDYNIRKLNPYVDYFILMAYDEYAQDSDAGPVSSQKWIEAQTEKILKETSPEKIILGLGAYGYDWSTNKEDNTSVTYMQAITKASASKAAINFDDNTFNLNYSYTDSKNNTHTVFFNDAASIFNTMRFSSEYPLAGTAVWRLGSEDSRIWNFYDKDLTSAGMSKLNLKELENVKGQTMVDYIGDGEVLDVLNTPHDGKIALEIDSKEKIITDENYITYPSSYEVKKYGEAPQKDLVLTFDDGPDETYTPQILDVLSKYHVPAAFFLVGLNAEKNLPLVKRIYREGHEIGNHTFTHENVAKVSPERALLEMKLTRLLIECVTGHSTILFRAPYNADSEPTTSEEIIPVALARQQNYLDIGENIDPEDWQPGIKADEIIKRVMAGIKQQRGNIILLHDAGGDTREETVKALKTLIPILQKQGYHFTNLASILHKNKNVLMPEVPKTRSYYIMQLNLVLATVIYEISHFLVALFTIFIGLGLIRLIMMMYWAYKERKKEKLLGDFPVLETYPKVSIIVPAYNEEVNIISSLDNLLKQTYPNFDIIMVDDGSKDSTFQKAKEAFSDHPKLKIFKKSNGGKATALNFGISQTDAEYVVCIDADTKLQYDAVKYLIARFLNSDPDDKIAAVAGNVKVGNMVNWLTRWQSIEYTTSQNFDRLAYAYINAVTVIPGAIGAFKKSVIIEAGGYSTDTLAEDCDITVKILRAGYTVANENRAVAVTEAPESVKQFLKQRFRWTYGIMQMFWKQRQTFLNPKYKGLGLWAMPNILLFQYIIPFFSPLADLIMFFGILSGNGGKIFTYYLIFLLVDASLALIAFIMQREKLSNLLYVIPQRFGYRWLMYIVLFRSLRKALKGEMQSWGFLKRTGNVKEIAAS
ncbi:Glycosyltransferase, catalytic subunit of cellulose synthase and poly-beta-1,6-N-acetylglucosamine synthase [Chryseobacterium oranimense]|uniref:Glycosyltransferase, catalytic subunit of cellulose synthase and poly-beta-1,6-N-acetylglucosamine synthase n=1 Tax=Chryseobacterium oranimense TaxID=421058 RepID=A0A1M5UH23_9FLAO|nr:polysaccharide deacetylase family protein [Chryseobacterium oranimense]SHH61943.1 Glycosyltransferase, catalytic subunit of cellulose synthase and poly-beta-1,6-N-acetylglucosamine synthase [Chryseobacterium oranimense]